MVAVHDAATGAPILRPGGAAEREGIPGTSGGWVARESTGAITFGSEHPDSHRVVTGDGAIMVAYALGAAPDGRDFRARYTYTWLDTSRRMPVVPSYAVTLKTPWTNLVEVRERTKFDRSAGRAAMVFAGVFMLFGALTIESGIDAPEARYLPGGTRVALGAALMVGAGLALVLGAFYAFAREPESVRYRR